MKVVLLGSTQVGKTSMLNRLTSGVFKEDSAATIGAAFQTHVMSTDIGYVTLQIWDTAGQERYRALTPMYYRSANVAILCFDLTNSESFKSLDGWMQELEEKGPTNLVTVLAGTKVDLSEGRVVKKVEAELFANQHSMAFYIECSAKNGKGITDLFSKVAELSNEQLRTEDRAVKRPGERLKPSNSEEKKSGGCC